MDLFISWDHWGHLEQIHKKVIVNSLWSYWVLIYQWQVASLLSRHQEKGSLFSHKLRSVVPSWPTKEVETELCYLHRSMEIHPEARKPADFLGLLTKADTGALEAQFYCVVHPFLCSVTVPEASFHPPCSAVHDSCPRPQLIPKEANGKQTGREGVSGMPVQVIILTVR